MDVKFGKLYPTGGKILNDPVKTDFSESNFFTSASNLPQNREKQEESKQSNSLRLNDWDSNILEENAYHDISDEVLKLEHKIDITEKNLAKITQEIETLQAFDDEIQLSDLIAQKEILENEITQLNQAYAQYGLGAKISGQIASAVRFGSKRGASFKSKAKKFIVKGVLTKLSKKFKCSQSVKDALTTLANINSDVDELVNMNVPYGEKLMRYDRLTAYLNKANVIHAHISKDLKVLKK
jgi:hypothetical protein